jgi:hypothetical protein
MGKIKITATFYQNNAIEIKRLVFVQPLSGDSFGGNSNE